MVIAFKELTSHALKFKRLTEKERRLMRERLFESEKTVVSRNITSTMMLNSQTLEQRRAINRENAQKFRERKVASSTGTPNKSPLKVKLDF